MRMRMEEILLRGRWIRPRNSLIFQSRCRTFAHIPDCSAFPRVSQQSLHQGIRHQSMQFPRVESSRPG